MTLLDILKENLPEGAVVKQENELPNRYKQCFEFDGETVNGEIVKTVSPGYEKSYVVNAIATMMSQIYSKKGDMEKMLYWLEIAQKRDMGSN